MPSGPYGYAGAWRYRTDGDAGLMHVGARYYDAQVGRFITRDTVLSEHPYLYCEHDPVNWVDPSGRIQVPDWIKVLIWMMEDVTGGVVGGDSWPPHWSSPPIIRELPQKPGGALGGGATGPGGGGGNRQ